MFFTDGMNPSLTHMSQGGADGATAQDGADAQSDQRTAGVALSDFVLQLEDYTPTVRDWGERELEDYTPTGRGRGC